MRALPKSLLFCILYYSGLVGGTGAVSEAASGYNVIMYVSSIRIWKILNTGKRRSQKSVGEIILKSIIKGKKPSEDEQCSPSSWLQRDMIYFFGICNFDLLSLKYLIEIFQCLPIPISWHTVIRLQPIDALHIKYIEEK